MLKHKSFILNCGNKPKMKVKPMSIAQTEVLEPKLATKEDIIEAAHYDYNEPILLSLPQSLNLSEEEPSEDHSELKDKVMNNNDISESQSYQSYDDDEDYSEANAYFEDATVYSQSYQKENEIKKKKDFSQPENMKVLEAHEAVVVDADADAIEDDITTIEQDKKFEEDIKAILNRKKQFDKARIEKNPEEALKDKNHGLMDKKADQSNEDRLKNDHAIFDKIAQSMNMASSYDLGSIAMDKKFDNLEKETDKDFTKKIHDLLEVDQKGKEDDVIHKTNDLDTLKKAAEILQDDDNKVETKDFLNDLDQLESMKIDEKSESKSHLSTQSSFNSTISIKHRYLKSRIFAVIGNTVEVMIDSNWTPTECTELTELNVTLTQSIDYWPDSEKGTKKFRIGVKDSKTWDNLEPGNYYLTFFFVNNTNPNCELKGTIEVKA